MSVYEEEIEQELIHDRHVARALIRSWPFLAFMLLAHASVITEYQKYIFIDTPFNINIYTAQASILLGIGIGLLISDADAIKRIKLNKITASSFEQILPGAAFLLSCVAIFYLHIAY